MSLTASANSTSTFTPVPPGSHLARCYRVVDLGTQSSEYLGKKRQQPKVMIQFEVHSEDEGGQPLVTSKGEPMSISKNFTLSLGEMATLRKDLESWRSRPFTSDELRGFELKNLLGAWAMLTISKSPGANGKEYTNIASINPVPAVVKKAGLPEGKNDLGIFSIEEPDMKMFESFSDSLQAKIRLAPEWDKGADYQKEQIASANSGSGFDDMDSDIPF